MTRHVGTKLYTTTKFVATRCWVGRPHGMTREHLSAVCVKDGVENPGCIGVSLLTAGQELWRERVVHEKTAAIRSRTASGFRHPQWMPPDGRFQTAAQQQLALRQEIFAMNWRSRQQSTVPNLAAVTGGGNAGPITGRVRSKPALTQPWSTTVIT